MSAGGRYIGLTVDDLLDNLASADPAPGAGFAAALSVAMGAAIVTMASRLSREWLDGRGSAAQAEALRKRVMELASHNAQAYAEALAALGGRQERYRTRDETMADALARAAEVPLDIGDAAAAVAALAAEVAAHGEPRFGADCAVAASLALAGARAAATLVEVNLGTTGDDPRLKTAREQVDAAAASLDSALTALA